MRRQSTLCGEAAAGSFRLIAFATISQQQPAWIAFQPGRDPVQAGNQTACVGQKFVELRRAIGGEFSQPRPGGLHQSIEIGRKLRRVVECVAGGGNELVALDGRVLEIGRQDLQRRTGVREIL
jgi:hypothetical protein